MKHQKKYLFFILLLFVFACKKEQKQIQPESCDYATVLEEGEIRNFKMGFSTWPFGATEEDKITTMNFIEQNSDIYCEQIDDKIPWSSLINNTDYPQEFLDEINFRVGKRVDTELFLAIDLLNTDRNDLLEDYDGKIPEYTHLYDDAIKNAFVKHVKWLIEQFSPDYLIISQEANELYIEDQEKWNEFKILIDEVKTEIKSSYPDLPVSVSIVLHNLFEPEDVDNIADYQAEVSEFIGTMDFAPISFYPFFKGMHTKTEFQTAFDFINDFTNKPIAFVETCHLAENLKINSYNLEISSDICEQNNYMEFLLDNAQTNDYLFVIWWSHRDFDALWETFPNKYKDLGKLWRDTGILDEDGEHRPAYTTWIDVFNHYTDVN